MKRCPTCKTEKPRSDFYADKRTADGLKGQCKKCHCATTIKSRDPDRKRAANARWMKLYAQRPEVIERERIRSRHRRIDPHALARRALNAAVRAGKVVRSATCERCGAAGRLNGHHRDYAKPLQVEWLCTHCHGVEHRKPSSFSVAEVRR